MTVPWTTMFGYHTFFDYTGKLRHVIDLFNINICGKDTVIARLMIDAEQLALTIGAKVDYHDGDGFMTSVSFDTEIEAILFRMMIA